MDKINIVHIIVNHYNTLKNIRTGKTSCTDIVIFFILPIAISIAVVIFNITINPIIGDVLKAIAIFSAFLFNMLAIVNSSLDKENVKKDKIKELYAKEIHSNLSFEIIIGILLVFFLIVQSILNGYTGSIQFYLMKIIEGINFFLLSIFLLTLIMCLNRVYILLRY